MAAPDRLYFTEDDDANELIARDPLALLIGFALDQQVPVPTAFQGPLKLKQRLGTLDARTIAETDPGKLEQIFRERPAIHRFPGSMARRVQELAGYVADEYGGDASRLWGEARDADDLRARIAALPGFGEMKIKSLGAVLSQRFGVKNADPLVPNHPTLGVVDSPAKLAEYQGWKKLHRAGMQRQSA